MKADPKLVEQLVEIITREVLIAMAEEERGQAMWKPTSASSIARTSFVYVSVMTGWEMC